jgi:hypothetical protein
MTKMSENKKACYLELVVSLTTPAYKEELD